MFSSVQMRVWILVALHLAAGLTCCLACLLHDGSQPHFAAQLAFMALLGSQMLLIGVVAATCPVSWWKKSLLGIAGLGYLSLIAFCGSLSQGYWPTPSEMLSIVGVLGLPIFVVVLGLSLVQWWTGVRVASAHLSSGHGVIAFRFSIWHLVVVTSGFAVSLGVLRWLRTDPILESAFVVIFALTLGACAVAMVWLLVWAALGQESPWRPLLLVFFATATIGLIPASLQRDGPAFHYVTWSSLFLAIAATVAGSLLVLRGDGWRLVGRYGAADRTSDGAQSSSTFETPGNQAPAVR